MMEIVALVGVPTGQDSFGQFDRNNHSQPIIQHSGVAIQGRIRSKSNKRSVGQLLGQDTTMLDKIYHHISDTKAMVQAQTSAQGASLHTQNNESSINQRSISNKNGGSRRQTIPLSVHMRNASGGFLNQESLRQQPAYDANTLSHDQQFVQKALENDHSESLKNMPQQNGESSQQILVNVWCNRPATQGWPTDDFVSSDHGAQQRIMSADNYLRARNRHQDNLPPQMITVATAGQQSVHQLMQHTLISHPGNCFLPNYKKNHMMRRYEDQYSQYIDSISNNGAAGITPQLRNHFQNKGKSKKQKKQKKLQLAVANETGSAIPLNIQVQNYRQVNNNSADLQSCLIQEYAVPEEYNVIKIQTAAPIKQDNKDASSSSFAQTTFISSPKRTSIPTVGSPHQNRDSKLAIATINDYAQGVHPQRVTIATHTHQAPLGYSPDYPQVSQGLAYLANNGYLNANQTDETVNNSSSIHNQYMQHQRLLDSRTFQLMLQDQAQASISKLTSNESPSGTDFKLMHQDLMLRNRNQHQMLAHSNSNPYPHLTNQNPLATGAEAIQDSREEELKSSPKQNNSQGVAHGTAGVRAQIDSHQAQKQLRKQIMEKGPHRQRNQSSHTNMSAGGRYKLKTNELTTEWQALNVGIFNLSMTGVPLTTTSGNQPVQSQSQINGAGPVLQETIQSNTGLIGIKRLSTGSGKETRSRPQSGSPSRMKPSNFNQQQLTANQAILQNVATITRIVPQTPNALQNQIPSNVLIKDDYQSKEQLPLRINQRPETANEQQSVADSSKNPITRSIEMLMIKNSTGFDYQSKATSQRDSTPNNRLILQHKGIYGGTEDHILMKEEQPLQQKTSGSAMVLQQIGEAHLNSDRQSSPLKKTVLTKQQNGGSNYDINQLSGPKIEQIQNQPLEVTQMLNTHRSSNYNEQQQELISFGIQVLNHNRVQTAGKKAKKHVPGSAKRVNKGEQGSVKSKKKNLGIGANEQIVGNGVSLRRSRKELNVDSITLKKSVTEQKNRRNNSGIVNIKPIPGMEGALGLFDSGGTNESNQQKLNFFDNRYAPDDELEVGHEKNSPSHMQPIKLPSSASLVLNLTQTRTAHQIAQNTITPLENPVYKDGSRHQFDNYYQVGPAKTLRDGGQTKQQLSVDYLKAGINSLSQPQFHLQRRHLEDKLHNADEQQLTQAQIHKMEEELVTLMNYQQQVSFPDISSEDFTASVKVNLGRIIASSHHDSSDPSLVPMLQYQQQPQYQLLPHQESKQGLQVVPLQVFSMVDGGNLQSKTLQQFIASKRQENVTMTGQMTKYGTPFGGNQLKKQSDEEKLIEQFNQIKQRHEMVSGICVQGANIKQMCQKLIQVQPLNSIGAPKLNADIKASNLVYIFDDIKQIEGGGINTTTLMTAPNQSEGHQYQAQSSMQLGINESQSNSDRQAFYQSTVGGAPGTLLDNKYNNSLPAIAGTLSSDPQQVGVTLTGQYYLRSSTHQQKNQIINSKLPVGGKSQSMVNQVVSNTDLSSQVISDQVAGTQHLATTSSVQTMLQGDDTVKLAQRVTSPVGSGGIVFNHFTIDSPKDSRPIKVTRSGTSPIGYLLDKKRGSDYILMEDPTVNGRNEENNELICDTLPLNQEASPSKATLNDKLITKSKTAVDTPAKYEDAQNQGILAKSYSKLMKNIGQDLKNIGPFSNHQIFKPLIQENYNRFQKSQTNFKSREAISGMASSEKINSQNQESSSAVGVTALLGMPIKAPNTAQGTSRRHLTSGGGILKRPMSPGTTNLVNLNISATVISNAQQVADARSRLRSSSQFSGEGAQTSSVNNGVPIKIKSATGSLSQSGQVTNSYGATWAQWPKQVYKPDETNGYASRTNIVVDNFSSNQNLHAYSDPTKIFVGSKNSRLQQRHGQFIRKQSANHRKVQSLFAQPQYVGQIAGLECLQNPAILNTSVVDPPIPDATRLIKTTYYNGVFSAKTFEMVVPERDQVIRVASSPARQQSKQQSRTPFNEFEQQQQQLKRPFSHNVSASKKVVAHDTISKESNKLRAFQRLKKGTVFRDEDFEAKRPNGGYKIY